MLSNEVALDQIKSQKYNSGSTAQDFKLTTAGQ